MATEALNANSYSGEVLADNTHTGEALSDNTFNKEGLNNITGTNRGEMGIGTFGTSRFGTVTGHGTVSTEPLAAHSHSTEALPSKIS